MLFKESEASWFSRSRPRLFTLKDNGALLEVTDVRRAVTSIVASSTLRPSVECWTWTVNDIPQLRFIHKNSYLLCSKNLLNASKSIQRKCIRMNHQPREYNPMRFGSIILKKEMFRPP